MPNGNTDKERLTALEVDGRGFDRNISEIKSDIREIKDNHLAHIQADINYLQRLFWMAMGAFSMLELVLKFLIK